jgi:8-oxo-dGTP pyrophosphatase MutT (NUDIX family)
MVPRRRQRSVMPFHNFVRDENGWQFLANETAFANPHLEVHRVTVSSPTRPEPFQWTVCHRKGAVVVAPLTAKDEFVLIRQERVPIRATIWEFPAGQIDEHAEHNEAAIRNTGLRELREESGYELEPGGSVIPLGHYFPSAGFTDEHSHLLLVRPVILGAFGRDPDAGEAITECRPFSVGELRAMIASGEIRDANTLAAFARMVALGLIRG